MTINVREFGATGDGNTDDRLAIKAAFQVASSLGGVPISSVDLPSRCALAKQEPTSTFMPFAALATSSAF